MPDFKDKERLDALRQRLYERGQNTSFVSARHALSKPRTVDIARGWGSEAVVVKEEDKIVPAPPPLSPPVRREVLPEPVIVPEREDISPDVIVPATVVPTRRRYRTIIMLSSLAVLLFVVVVSSVFLFFGGNQISGKNISFELTGPLAVAGGDVLEMQVAINNMNTVAIEGATLIISYPSGTKSLEDEPRDLYQERIPLETIASGEARSVPIKAAVFGEENEEKEVSATIEYRVTGSNGTFYKEATPIKFTINSSSLVLRVDTVEKISSGQEFDVTVTLQSNSPTPLKNVLLSATYPENFNFIRAEPEPEYRENEWVIEDLPANGKYQVKIRGTASGVTSDAFQLKFQAGTPRSDNQYIVGSVLAQTISAISVEQPFIGMKIAVAGDSDGEVVLSSGSAAEVVISVTNTHSDPIYDMTLRVTPTGTAFNESNLSVTDGFYDSVNKQIRWESSGMASLSKVLPGEKRDFIFKINADDELKTAALDISAKLFAKRLSENQVSEELMGVKEGVLRFASVAKLDRQIDHGTGGYTDVGPIPPVANQKTTYTLSLVAQAGANDLTGTVVTAKLPQYVEWLNIANGGRVEFNPINKELRWTVGDLKGSERRSLSFQVAFVPSVLQVNTSPVIMGGQELKATDRFTGTPLQALAPPITTELSSEAGFDRDSGNVLISESSSPDNNTN